MRLAIVMVLVLLGGSSPPPARAEAPVSVHHTGPSSNRVDLVFLGDGYRQEELPQYAADVDRAMAHLFAEEPYSRYREYFNVHRVDVVSQESGADMPQNNIEVDTALSASYQSDGANDSLLYIDQAKADAVVTSALTGTEIEADARLVAVNSPVFGGGAVDYAVFAASHLSGPEIGFHELGHSLHSLTDEYVSFVGETYQGAELHEHANVTIDPSGAKWEAWLGYEQEGIGLIGAYEGGHYYEKGVYRPSLDSKMRTLGRPFDAVSREKMVLDIYEHVRPLDAWRPNDLPVEDGGPLWVQAVDESLLAYEWIVSGEPLEVTGPELDLTEQGFLPDSYIVHVTAQDATDWVRRDRDGLSQSVVWVVHHYPGDFDNNRQVDAVDIDTLTAAIREQSGDLQFDLNGDGLLSGLDRDTWLQGAGSFYGDADLDGDVDFPDFLALAANFGLPDPGWAGGDFNLEPGVAFGDFLLLAVHFGSTREAAAAAVPEPDMCGGFLLVLLLLRSRRRRRTTAVFAD